ncbi:carboxypeptidase-like regulatory domain-containing protein [Fulvivirga maritima]|uniref:carboxypeptidase-like regulatory domain-containing protein n=1 Tax=Fulvivirga maritima TaxID=2904247 RepID=UPI001F1F1F30|nr:carboxypeptidase-like regulatory domain-containing protein [Fulvivirga maritima]UII27667.1 carboxypeptidase-like regulatory domain-containing protein [Fulvivirga maritima]
MLILCLGLLFSSQNTQAQGKKRVIQLSGIILGEDSVAGVPGVNVYVPKAGRGTSTNRVGYFSMPTLVGDEIVISAVGFEKQYYRVPDTEGDNLTILVELISDTTFLETVEIMPFPTEEIFKEAVLALNLPVSEDVNSQNLNDELLALMMQTTPMDGYVNYRYYMDNWAMYQNDRFGPRPNPLLNPFNWARFFKGLKNKKKD